MSLGDDYNGGGVGFDFGWALYDGGSSFEVVVGLR